MKYINPLTGQANELDPENPTPGIYGSVPHDIYLSIRAVSRSGLVAFNEAPERYGLSMESTDAMRFGTLYHAYLLEPDMFKKEYQPGPVKSNGAIKQPEWNAAYEFTGGKIYKPSELDQMDAMRKSMIEFYPKSYGLLTSDNPCELTVVARHPASGLLIKVRIDIAVLEPRWIGDLKTAKDVTEHSFRYSVMKYGYDFQSGFYVLACQLTEGLESINNFVIIAQEKEPPYAVRRYDMGVYVDKAYEESERILCDMAEWFAAGRPYPDELIEL